MLYNYFKIAVRHIVRDRAFAFINILGLAIGLACSILIALFVYDELTYEQSHEKSERIYRLACEYFLPNDGGSENMAVIGAPVGPVVKQDFPQVEHFTRIRQRADVVIERESSRERFYERIHFIDSTAFDVFSLPLIDGDPQTALSNPNSIVLSEKMAQKYFGTKEALGERLTFPEDTLELLVTGVMENMPGNTSLQMDFLLPYHLQAQMGVYMLSWWGFNTQTYLLMKEGINIDAFANDIRRVSANHIADQEESSGYRQEYFLQALGSIHLHSKLRGEFTPNSEAKYVYIFALIGAFILLIACINFMNLATARSSRRAKEIGLRKVVGARRPQLITQMLSEAIVLSVPAMLFALLIVFLTIPSLNDLTAKSLSFTQLLHPTFIATLFVVTLGVGVLSGSYPALFLSAYRPIETLKGIFTQGGRGSRLREGLVIFQFAISITLIASTLIIYQQIQYMQQADLGFAKEQVIFLPTHRGVNTQQTFNLLKEELEELPEVEAASLSSHVPGHELGNNVVRKGWTSEAEWSDMRFLSVDYDFVKTYQVELAAGRSFDESYGTDQEEAFLLNEAGIKRLGWNTPEEALGQKLRWQRKQGRVIGVVKDFYFMSVQNPIEPFIFVMANHQHNRVGYLSLRLNSDDYPKLISKIETIYSSVLPNRSFEYHFLDEDFNQQYQSEMRFGTLFVNFSLLAIFIACLGLFGLAAFNMTQRIKEVSIRKVLGASTSSIAGLLSRKFMVLVGVAFLIATPISWVMMRTWLNDFSYRIQPDFWHFLIAGMLAFLIALLTISFHVWKSTRTNPAMALRNE